MADDHDVLSQTIGSLHSACSPLLRLKAIIMIILSLPSSDPRKRRALQTPTKHDKEEEEENQSGRNNDNHNDKTIRMKRTSGTTSKEGFSPPTTKSQAKKVQNSTTGERKTTKATNMENLWYLKSIWTI